MSIYGGPGAIFFFVNGVHQYKRYRYHITTIGKIGLISKIERNINMTSCSLALERKEAKISGRFDKEEKDTGVS